MKYVYGNAQAVETSGDRRIYPERVSHVLWDEFWNSHIVAEFSEENFKKLCAIDDKDWDDAAWWREICGANFSIEEAKGLYGKGYKTKTARMVGLLLYICDQFGASTERNVAAVIGSMAAYEGKDPVKFFNTFYKL